MTKFNGARVRLFAAASAAVLGACVSTAYAASTDDGGAIATQPTNVGEVVTVLFLYDCKRPSEPLLTAALSWRVF